MQGTATYAPEKDAMVWKIKNFPGGREFVMRCRFALPSVAAEEESTGRMPPIRVNFELPYFTVSGIQVCHRPASIWLLVLAIIFTPTPHVPGCTAYVPLSLFPARLLLTNKE